MNREERIATIHNFMKDQFGPRVKPRPIKWALWPSMVVLTAGRDVHRPFGYSSAQYFPYDDKWAFFYCADVMADISAELEDLAFDDWLRYVRAHISTHTQLDTQDEAEVDRQVFNVLPEARDLVGRVHEQLLVF